MINKPALLVLSDGTVMEGISIGATGDCVGELVFNTAMTGYQEILTDPSYAKQVVTLTSAHIGNTGCNDEDMESSRAWAAGLVVRNCTLQPSHYAARDNLPDWLKKQGVVAIAGIDTRHLTHRLRELGAVACCITTHVSQVERAHEKALAFAGLSGMDISVEVSRKAIERWYEGRHPSLHAISVPPTYHVVAYDFGIKHNLLRILHDKGCHITVVPARISADEVMALNPDGIFLSNGPGDPAACVDAIASTKIFLEASIPIFGVCLGFQILALALGATSLKMKFGHHGANHPVSTIEGQKRVFITSQNHGFAIDEDSLPSCLIATHRSLFDNSLQGIKHVVKPAFGFQGHPEASPGPHDIEGLFDQFIAMMHPFSKQDNS